MDKDFLILDLCFGIVRVVPKKVWNAAGTWRSERMIPGLHQQFHCPGTLREEPVTALRALPMWNFLFPTLRQSKSKLSPSISMSPAVQALSRLQELLPGE